MATKIFRNWLAVHELGSPLTIQFVPAGYLFQYPKSALVRVDGRIFVRIADDWGARWRRHHLLAFHAGTVVLDARQVGEREWEVIFIEGRGRSAQTSRAVVTLPEEVSL